MGLEFHIVIVLIRMPVLHPDIGRRKRIEDEVEAGEENRAVIDLVTGVGHHDRGRRTQDVGAGAKGQQMGG